MIPTFVIGLREGLEAALIVGIIAAFLGQQGRRDALRQVWIGTFAAIVICIGIGIGLQVISSGLPQRQQEGLETAVGALALYTAARIGLWQSLALTFGAMLMSDAILFSLHSFDRQYLPIAAVYAARLGRSGGWHPQQRPHLRTHRRTRLHPFVGLLPRMLTRSVPSRPGSTRRPRAASSVAGSVR